MTRKIYTSTLNRTVKNRNGKEKQVTDEVTAVAFTKGQKLFVCGILGSTAEDLATIKELSDDHLLVIFNQDVLATVEGLSDNLLTCRHLLFVRPNRPYVKKTEAEKVADLERTDQNTRKPPAFHHHVTLFGRLLAACLQGGRKPISVPGGLKFALAFRNDEKGEGGEMIIAAPRKGTEVNEESAGEVCIGFIVANSEREALLAKLPKRESVKQNEKQATFNADGFAFKLPIQAKP
ncbi:MAG: hypothetical protein HY226_01495 [Candidatus Vogelbacteria bacterium]|nr:hypothetical protein [Candidatus Vogelbacteria bacterium]